MLTLLSFAILFVIIATHEYGHYVANWAFGVPVDTFSIGIGWGKYGSVGFDWRGTRWQLGLIPVGGFVSAKTDSYANMPRWKVIVIYAAGPLMGLFGAYLASVALTAVMGAGWPDAVVDGGVILGKLLQKAFGAVFHVASHPAVFYDAAPSGRGMTANYTVVEQSSVEYLLAAFVGFSLAVNLFNLLPVPGLDGGQIVMAAVEWVIGRRIPDSARTLLTLATALFILSTIVVGLYHDVIFYTK